jgi:hypothetical protein
MSGRPRSAGDYGPYLLSLGASEVAADNYVAQTGDIAVFAKTETHPHGHIQIYGGSQWISDYKQNRFQPYRSDVSYKIYRFP